MEMDQQKVETEFPTPADVPFPEEESFVPVSIEPTTHVEQR
jgi:hypothetical protein